MMILVKTVRSKDDYFSERVIKIKPQMTKWIVTESGDFFPDKINQTLTLLKYFNLWFH